MVILMLNYEWYDSSEGPGVIDAGDMIWLIDSHDFLWEHPSHYVPPGQLAGPWQFVTHALA